MENNLKNELSRMFTLMEYSYSKSKNFITEGEYTEKNDDSDEKNENYISINRSVGNKFKIEFKANKNELKTDSLEIPNELYNELVSKLSQFKVTGV